MRPWSFVLVALLVVSLRSDAQDVQDAQNAPVPVEAGPAVQEPSAVPPGQTPQPAPGADAPVDPDAEQSQAIRELREELATVEEWVEAQQMAIERLQAERAELEAQLEARIEAQGQELEVADDRAVAQVQQAREEGMQLRVDQLERALLHLSAAQEIVEAGSDDIEDHLITVAEELARAAELAGEWGTPLESHHLVAAEQLLGDVSQLLATRNFLQAQLNLELAERHAAEALALARTAENEE